MKQRPILFNTEMVQAIIEGRKTQTRRIYKKAPTSVDLYSIQKHSKSYILSQCPYGNPGDILWVRETWALPVDENGSDAGYQYKADYDDKSNCWKWKPSIHMPKEACRIWLKITDVRVERLQDIKEKDAISEGIEVIHMAADEVPVYRNYLLKEKLGSVNPIRSFENLWKSINGKDSWKHNPWVWVIEFERIEKPKN